MEKKLICAITLARSGSKGIKNKNITSIKGKPLLYYAAKQASLVKKIDKVFILTDSLQLGDNYILDPLLEFFPYSTHEPYYSKYIREDLESNAEKFGLKMYYSKNAYLSKTLAFKKI